LEWASGDDVQPEAILAIFEVMIMTDELGRGAVAVGDPDRAEPRESEPEVLLLGAVIYNVHFQNLLCNLLLERRAPIPLGQRFSPPCEEEKFQSGSLNGCDRRFFQEKIQLRSTSLILPARRTTAHAERCRHPPAVQRRDIDEMQVGATWCIVFSAWEGIDVQVCYR